MARPRHGDFVAIVCIGGGGGGGGGGIEIEIWNNYVCRQTGPTHTGSCYESHVLWISDRHNISLTSRCWRNNVYVEWFFSMARPAQM